MLILLLLYSGRAVAAKYLFQCAVQCFILGEGTSYVKQLFEKVLSKAKSKTLQESYLI